MKYRFFPKSFNFPLFLFISAIVFQTAFSQKNFNEKRNLSFSLNGGNENIALLTRPRIYKSAEQIAAENVRPPVSSSSANTSEIEHRVFDMVNQERIKAGLTALAWNDDVARVARLHSSNMANFHFFSHQGLDGKMVNNRADDLGLTKWRQMGENIAYNRGFKSPLESAVQSWMNSAGHRENILKADWKESGIGVVVLANGTYYFTQVFLRKN